MADDLYSVLARFHRETVLPDIDKRIGGVREEIPGEIAGLRDEMREEIGGLRQEMRGEIGGLRQEMREEIGDLRREVLSHFDAIYARFDRLESVHRAIAAAVSRMERAA